MVVGLSKKTGSVLPMLPSYAVKLPTGDEKGMYYALDLGGTNFRMLRVELNGKGAPPKFAIKEVEIPAECMRCTAEDLFGFIADSLGAFLFWYPGKGAGEAPAPLGFCFSFPMEQKSLDSGILLAWTKGYANTSGVGADVVALLQAELRKRSINMKVEALLNDTVGTMAAG
eukprot:4458457-Pyramimonas_sp.AAC.1